MSEEAADSVGKPITQTSCTVHNVIICTTECAPIQYKITYADFIIIESFSRDYYMEPLSC